MKNERLLFMSQKIAIQDTTWKKVALATVASASILAFGGLNAHAADIHSVQSGETVWALTKAKYGTTNLSANIAKIENINNITDPTKLYVGQKIDLDVTSTGTASQTSSTTSSQSTATTSSTSSASQQSQAPTTSSTQTVTSTKTYQAPVATGSVYQQFIAAGGTSALWTAIVIPESGGNPDITSPNGYHGLGQTKQAWGYGSVATQTQGMISYAVSRYGSVSNAVAFRQSHGWW